MIQYRWLLMDADNTLFDFNAAEEFALTRTLIRILTRTQTPTQTPTQIRTTIGNSGSNRRTPRSSMA